MAGDRIIWGYYVPIQKTCAAFNMAVPGVPGYLSSGEDLYIEVFTDGKSEI